MAIIPRPANITGCDGVKCNREKILTKTAVLDTDFGNEAPNKYDDDIYSDLAAVTDLQYYRRGVRLINGTTIPGILRCGDSVQYERFYIGIGKRCLRFQGNYNATGVASVPSTGNTPYTNYLPHRLLICDIPASIVGDAVTVLSNTWNDAESFAYPYD